LKKEAGKVATIKGKIKAISISRTKGTPKTNVPKAELKTDYGVVGDAHAGNWHRQVSFLAVESIDKMIEIGAEVSPGIFAENITTQGIKLPELPIGSRIIIGESAELEITQIGNVCHNRCAIYEQVGDCVMPRDGVFAKVTRGGLIKVGDIIKVLND
jgi:MOSC domain-containing protein YiiM